jgi:branched-chain amino acid transport system permease protein
MQAVFPVVVLSVPLLAFWWLGTTTGSALLRDEITTGFVNVVLVVGLYIFVGNSGVIAFGQLAFAGIGAYAAALLTIDPSLKAVQLPELPSLLANAHLSFIPALIAAGLFTMAVALVVAFPFMRLNGIAAGIATFAGLIVVRTVLSNWESVTRGKQQMIVPLNTNIDNALAFTIAFIALAYAYQRSPWGLRLRASRENLAAASALGIWITRERTIAFALSAFFVAVGGALYGHFLGAFSPDAFYLDLTFLVFTMLVVGGLNSLSGAVIGAIVISSISVFLTRAEQTIEIAGLEITAPTGMRDIALGVILLVIVLLRPAGLTGGREVKWPSRWAPRLRRLPEPGVGATRAKEGDVAA